LLREVIEMEQNGIEKCWTSNHYMPWWQSGASGGAALPWMGTAWPRMVQLWQKLIE
jgi:hypothetical protein